jgi:glycine cleavage system H protein
MVKVKEYDLPDDLHYHKQHMWVRVEGDVAVVGITDFTCKAAGEITYIELPDTDEEVEADDLVGSVETGKWMGKLYAPVSGEVIEVNEDAADEPGQINEDPYGAGWLFKIRMGDPAQVEGLMKGQDAVSWLEQEIATHLTK